MPSSHWGKTYRHVNGVQQGLPWIWRCMRETLPLEMGINREVMLKRTVKASKMYNNWLSLWAAYIKEQENSDTAKVLQFEPHSYCSTARWTIIKANFRLSKNVPGHLWNGWPFEFVSDLADYRNQAVWDRKDHFVSLTTSVPHDRISVKSEIIFSSDSAVRQEVFIERF
jgi:hypothetical protein